MGILKSPFKVLALALSCLFTALSQSGYPQTDNLEVKQVKLPSLRIDGEQALAHTQGLEIVGNKYYVTARRDDVRPRRPILVCFDVPQEPIYVSGISP